MVVWGFREGEGEFKVLAVLHAWYGRGFKR